VPAVSSCATGTMRGRLWSLVGAAIGAAILAILFAFGIEYGTWVDEAGQLEVPPPAFVFPFVIGCLAIVLLVGGLMASASSSGTSTDPGR
jgi:hypothetical protein